MAEPATNAGDHTSIVSAAFKQIDVANLMVEDDPEEDSHQDDVQMLRLQAFGIMVLLVTIVICGIIYVVANSISTSLASTFPTAIQPIVFFTVLSAAALGAYYGLYFSHRYGGTTQQLDIIEAAAEVLKENNKIFDEQATSLGQEVDGLRSFTDKKLQRTQHRFASVIEDGKEIGRIGKLIQGNNKQTTDFFNDIEEILRLTNLLQRQICKNRLVSMFYELEYVGDDRDGLNKAEYKKLLSRLDKDTADTFREVTSFRRMDKDLNGRVSLREFQRALDTVYNALDKKDRVTVEQLNKTQQAEF